MECRDGSVRTGTDYEMDGPRIESRWVGGFSTPVQTGPGAQEASCTMRTRSSRGKERPGRGLDHIPPTRAEIKEKIWVDL